MTGDGSIELFFGDGMRRFRLGIGEFRELQEKVNGRRVAIGLPAVGPSTLSKELRASDAWPDDVRDVLRIGLVGAGAKPAEVHRLLVNHFDGKPPAEHYLTAFTVLVGAFLGVPGDEVSAKKATGPAAASQTGPSSSPNSTETVQ